MKAFIISLLLCSTCFACEFGTTYKDFYGKPNSYDSAVCDDNGAYYFPNGSIEYMKDGTIWERVHFDKNGIIEIKTGYVRYNLENPLPKGREPYVLYKGHR